MLSLNKISVCFLVILINCKSSKTNIQKNSINPVNSLSSINFFLIKDQYKINKFHSIFKTLKKFVTFVITFVRLIICISFGILHSYRYVCCLFSTSYKSDEKYIRFLLGQKSPTVCEINSKLFSILCTKSMLSSRK